MFSILIFPIILKYIIFLEFVHQFLKFENFCNNCLPCKKSGNKYFHPKSGIINEIDEITSKVWGQIGKTLSNGIFRQGIFSLQIYEKKFPFANKRKTTYKIFRYIFSYVYKKNWAIPLLLSFQTNKSLMFTHHYQLTVFDQGEKKFRRTHIIIATIIQKQSHFNFLASFLVLFSLFRRICNFFNFCLRPT